MMSELDPSRWAEVQRLFADASELPPEERAAFLERECTDPAILREVRSLLEYSQGELHTAAASIAAVASVAAREADPDQRLIGARLGPYKVEAIVGHGGMGAVYRACRDDGEFHQQVALKLVRAASQTTGTLQRFKQERQILASLAHPNIARLLDGGSTPDGVPYLVMEFIEGDPITAWCERQSLSIEQRLRLFLSVCEGVEFAHRNLVVHRDLKPGNILVTADGVPKLLDFGIAKMLGPEADAEAATTVGMQVMTPEYAAPEQVRGDPVSKLVDVYALGLVLYELLTGQKAQNIPSHTPGTVARVVCQTEPVAPAARNAELAGDLDNIIRMAIRKEPERRYGSAADLARDIQLHLDGRPVAARPDSAAYRMARFLQRNRATVTAAALTAVLFAGVGLTYRLRAPGQAPRVLRVAQVTQTGHVELGGGLVTVGSSLYLMEGIPGQRRLARVSVEGGPSQLLFSAARNSAVLDVSPDRTKLLFVNGSGVDVFLWEMPATGGTPRRIGDVPCHAAAWSPDGKSIAFGGDSALYRVNSDGTGWRKLLDTTSRPLDLQWGRPHGGPDVLRYNLRSPDGHIATLWEARPDGTDPHPLLPNWNTGKGCMHSDDDGHWMAGGAYFLFRSLCGPVYNFAVIKEGRAFLETSGQPPVLIHSTSTRIGVPAPSPDGKRVFFVSELERREFVRYDPARREFVPYLRGVPGQWASFSRDGQWVAYTTTPQQTLWRSRTDGSEAQQLTPPSLRAYAPNWSPDGAWIVFTGFPAGPTYGIYAIPSAGGVPQRLSPADAADMGPSWSPDGRSVLFYRSPATGTAGEKGLYLLDWKARKTSAVPGSENWEGGFWSPDGRRIAVTDGTHILLYEMRTRRRTLLASGKAVGYPAWSRNGKYVYYQDRLEPDMSIFRVPVTGGTPERMMSSRQIPQSDWSAYNMVCLAPDDSPVASVIRDNSDIYALELELP